MTTNKAAVPPAMRGQRRVGRTVSEGMIKSRIQVGNERNTGDGHHPDDVPAQTRLRKVRVGPVTASLGLSMTRFQWVDGRVSKPQTEAEIEVRMQSVFNSRCRIPSRVRPPNVPEQ